MKSIRIIATAIGLLCISQVVAEEIPGVIAKTSRASVQVADPFSLELTVSAPVGSKVTFPATGDTLGEFEILKTHDRSDVPSAKVSDHRTWARRMTLVSIATGDLEIPAIEVQVASNGESQVIRSQPIGVHVASVLEDRSDPTKFRDIESVVDFTIPTVETKSVAWLALGGFCLFAATIATGIVVSRRQKWLTPKQWAMEKLDQLEQVVQTPDAEFDVLTMELTNIVREFLLMQFQISESGCTAQELLMKIVSQKRLDQATVNQLGALFTLADKAKFAGWQLSATGLQSAINDSRGLIQAIDLEQSQVPRDADHPHSS